MRHRILDMEINSIRYGVLYHSGILRNSNQCIAMSEVYKQITNTVEPNAKVIVINGWVDTTICDAILPKNTVSLHQLAITRLSAW